MATLAVVGPTVAQIDGLPVWAVVVLGGCLVALGVTAAWAAWSGRKG